MKRIYSALLSALVFACGAAEDGDEFDTTEPDATDELGAAGFGWKVQPSAVGGRTFGSDTGGKACTKTSNVTCRFITSYVTDPVFPLASSGEQVIKICVTPINWDPGDFQKAAADVDTFVSNMNVAMQGSATPYSFSRVQPPLMGSDCNASTAQIIVNAGIAAKPWGDTYRQFATPTFSSCTQLLETPADVSGVYQRCTKAVINAAYRSIAGRGGEHALVAGRIRTQQSEALMNALLGVVGIGSQTSNPTFVSNPTMSDTSSKFFISNEEKCRLKTLTGANSDLFQRPVEQIAFSTTTCSN